jgi:DNA repair exonuclease SbcCD ATPase subunit
MKSLRKAKKRPAGESEDVCPVCGRRSRDATAEHMERVLEKVEQKLEEGDVKPTIGDYLRLLQYREEMKLGEPPKEIRVTWVEPEGETGSEN